MAAAEAQPKLGRGGGFLGGKAMLNPVTWAVAASLAMFRRRAPAPASPEPRDLLYWQGVHDHALTRFRQSIEESRVRED